MLKSAGQYREAVDKARLEELEALIRADYERARLDDTLEDLKRRARFSKQDKALLGHWMRVAERRAAVGAKP